MILIRSWTQSDIDYVAESVKRERWGHTRRDVERCWQFEPNGCFVADFGDMPVGHVFSICYGRVGWIGLLVVNQERRGRGVGTVLMRAAIEYLQCKGAETIRLEAVERAVPLYKRLGFSEEFDSLRFSKQLKRGERYQHCKENVLTIREEDIEEMAEFDSEYFGAERLRVLRSLYVDQPQLCFVAKQREKILGYVMGRKLSNAYWIGPWVSEDPQTSETLLYACIDTVRMKEEEVELRLGVPIVNRNGIALMEKLGFQRRSRSIRMVNGKFEYHGQMEGIYGIGAPEKG